MRGTAHKARLTPTHGLNQNDPSPALSTVHSTLAAQSGCATVGTLAPYTESPIYLFRYAKPANGVSTNVTVRLSFGIIKHSLHGDTNCSDLQVTLIGVAATQRVHVEIANGHNDSVQLAISTIGSIGRLLGFAADKYFPVNTTTSRQSDTTASLDRTTSVLVQTSLCSGSVVAGKGGQST